MANHVRRQLREAIATALAGLTTTGARVFQSRSYPLTDADLPGLIVYTTSEEASGLTVTAPLVYARELEVVVKGVAAAVADLDDTLDLIAKEVEVALAAGVTISARVIDLEYQGCDIELDTQAEKPLGSVTLRYRARLYAAAATPDVFS